MLKKIFIVTLLLTSFALPQSAGKSGMAFLKYGIGARNVAMGDIGSVIATDASAAFYNPAVLASNSNSEVMFMHNQWIQDIKSEVVGAKFELWGIPLGFGANVTNIGDIEVRTKPGEALSTFSANYFCMSLSSGFTILDDLDFGFSAKYLYEGIYVNSASGTAFDLGLKYKTSVKGLTASAVVKNLGSMNNLGLESTKLPTEARAGVAYNYVFENTKFQVNAGTEVQKYLPTDDMHVNLGGEVVYDNMIALRAGYQSGYTAKSFCGGVGIIWGSLSFDYAFAPYTYQLGTGNSVSLNFKF